MADESILKKALNTLKQGQEFVFPHASKNPYAPMAYVKDFNEWFVPSAQMALDEAQGEEDYPAWAYGLASLPVVGKVGKVAGKVAKGLGKGGKISSKEAQNLMSEVAKAKDYYGDKAYKNFVDAEHPEWKPSMSLEEAKAIESELKNNTPYFNGMTKDEAFVAGLADENGEMIARKPSPEWTLVKEEPKKLDRMLSGYSDDELERIAMLGDSGKPLTEEEKAVYEILNKNNRDAKFVIGGMAAAPAIGIGGSYLADKYLGDK